MDYSRLPTEKQNPKTASLDTLAVEKILRLIDREDQSVPRAVKRVNPALARGVRMIVSSLKSGGRLFFFGAGTSGRLGVLEAAECPPTFNTPPHLAQALMAGGKRAVFRSQEGAEDRAEEARREVRKRVRKGDVVIGITASGVTPFVQGALQESKKRRARTILVACNHSFPLRSYVDLLIAPQVGPEVIAGSTRLKAGTATKLVLNRLTVASMVQLGKVYGNWMVDLQPRSKKLKARALRMVKRFTRLSDQRVKALLTKSKGNVKIAILMARRNLSYREALRTLQQTDGFLREALR
jgi:N-acetylmuramic acid 6-phosphate etherase